jgi:hypothetical protein
VAHNHTHDGSNRMLASSVRPGVAPCVACSQNNLSAATASARGCAACRKPPSKVVCSFHLPTTHPS